MPTHAYWPCQSKSYKTCNKCRREDVGLHPEKKLLIWEMTYSARLVCTVTKTEVLLSAHPTHKPHHCQPLRQRSGRLLPWDELYYTAGIVFYKVASNHEDNLPIAGTSYQDLPGENGRLAVKHVRCVATSTSHLTWSPQYTRSAMVAWVQVCELWTATSQQLRIWAEISGHKASLSLGFGGSGRGQAYVGLMEAREQIFNPKAIGLVMPNPLLALFTRYGGEILQGCLQGCHWVNAS